MNPATSEDHLNEQVALPSLADQKLDRQLRLWGAEGQRLLQSTCVILFGATATGSEALKNVILPNVGAFLIADNTTVTNRHLGNNFFLDHDAKGASLATVVTSRLAELNPDVVALPPLTRWSPNDAVTQFLRVASSIASSSSLSEEEPQQREDDDLWQPLLSLFGIGCERTTTTATATDPHRFRQVVLVTTTSVDHTAVVRLSKALTERNGAADTTGLLLTSTIALVHVESSGLVGSLRVQSSPLFVHHAHPSPDMIVSDLAITRPFPALQEWFHNHDPRDDAQFAHDIDKHSHLPWPCVLYHAIRMMREDRGLSPEDATLPKTPLDYRDLKQYVLKLRRRDAPQQECIAEALDQCKMTIDVRRRFTQQLEDIFADVRSQQPSAAEDPMWFVAYGLRRFRAQHDGYLPLTGSLPDITTYTGWYSELQQLYRTQAALEAGEVYHDAIQAMQQAALTPPPNFESLVRDVCAHSWELSYVAFNSIAAEAEADGLYARLFAHSCNDESFLSWYVALRAQQLFREMYQRAPGDCRKSDDAESGVDWIVNEALWADDIATLTTIATEKILGRHRDEWWSLPAKKQSLQDRLKELCRYGGGELPTTAAIVGAVVGQEVIKLAQRRRIPAHDAVVFDGNLGAFGTIVTI